jgi:hypothetical protein
MSGFLIFCRKAFDVTVGRLSCLGRLVPIDAHTAPIRGGRRNRFGLAGVQRRGGSHWRAMMRPHTKLLLAGVMLAGLAACGTTESAYVDPRHP